MKNGLENFFLKFLHAEAIFLEFILLSSFQDNHKLSNKNNHLPAWRKIGNMYFFAICNWPNSPVRAKVLPRFLFEGKNDVGISEVRRVKFRVFWLFKFKVFVHEYLNLLFKNTQLVQVWHDSSIWSHYFKLSELNLKLNIFEKNLVKSKLTFGIRASTSCSDSSVPSKTIPGLRLSDLLPAICSGKHKRNMGVKKYWFLAL